MALFDRKNKDAKPADPAEGGEGVEQVEEVEQPDDGITEIEGFVDPFEDDWDDAEMGKSLKEWERLLADVEIDRINSLDPGTSEPNL